LLEPACERGGVNFGNLKLQLSRPDQTNAEGKTPRRFLFSSIAAFSSIRAFQLASSTAKAGRHISALT
jgi:hypothetical protein